MVQATTCRDSHPPGPAISKSIDTDRTCGGAFPSHKPRRLLVEPAMLTLSASSSRPDFCWSKIDDVLLPTKSDRPPCKRLRSSVKPLCCFTIRQSDCFERCPRHYPAQAHQQGRFDDLASSTCLPKNAQGFFSPWLTQQHTNPWLVLHLP